MYNQYIPDDTSYTPVEPFPTRKEAASPRGNEGGSAQPFFNELLKGEQGLAQLLRDKLGVSKSGIWKHLKDSGIDTGDILLVLILLLILKEQEEHDILLALGAVMLLDGKKKEKQGDD